MTATQGAYFHQMALTHDGRKVECGGPAMRKWVHGCGVDARSETVRGCSGKILTQPPLAARPDPAGVRSGRVAQTLGETK